MARDGSQFSSPGFFTIPYRVQIFLTRIMKDLLKTKFIGGQFWIHFWKNSSVEPIRFKFSKVSFFALELVNMIIVEYYLLMYIDTNIKLCNLRYS